MKILLYRIVVAALLFLIGCTPSKEVNVSRLSSPDDVNRFYVEREKQIRTFTGSGNITIETPELSNNVSFTVTINRPDSLMIKLKGPFGISLGTLFITDNKFLFLNNVEKKILVNMPFSTNDLVNIFTGSYGYSVMDYSNARLDFNGVNYLLENNTEAERKEMTIDGANNNFLKLIHRDHYGKVITEIYARSYENVDGVNLPYWMRIIFPKQHRSLTITYDEIKINNTVNFNLSLPRELQN